MIEEKQAVDTAVETVTKAVTTHSIMSHLKANRIEYIGLIILCHLLGVSDRLLAQVPAMCI